MCLSHGNASPNPHPHGAGVRGLTLQRNSPSFEGRFGRMARTLPHAQFNHADLDKLGDLMAVFSPITPIPEDQPDPEENTGISAGYTYLGQFIDHDLTFDPASSLQKQNDPEALVDFRTPRFDLDCLYGRGPEDQPYLYRDNLRHMLLGNPLTGNSNDPHTYDLPRNTPFHLESERALIGDPRNDQHIIISQLHATFIRFHNRVVDFMTSPTLPDFAEVQRVVRWHYQWVVLHDFLPTIIGWDMVTSILPHLNSGTSIHVDKPDLRFYKWRNAPYIPVEFSVAAYRFGHSMVRPIYRLNTTLPDRQQIFDLENPQNSLLGFQAVPKGMAVDWSLFFPNVLNGAPPIELGPNRVQKAYKIDTSLVNPLSDLPNKTLSSEGYPSNLAARNLLRGYEMGLPSGQTMAKYMGVPVLSDDVLCVGKATEADTPTNPRLVDEVPSLKNNAPLWYYILAEAQQQFVNDKTPIRLGSVGGRIVGEVFIGLLLGDSHSFLSQQPDWTPPPAFQRNGTFGIAELIYQAMQSG